MHLFIYSYKKYTQTTNSSNNYVFYYMGIFNIDDNIRKIRFKDRFSKVDYSVSSRVSSLELFFKGTDIFNLTSLLANKEMYKLSGQFTDYIFSNDFWIDPEEDLPTQLKEALKKFTDYDVEIDNKTIIFNNKLHHYLATAYEQFVIRSKFGMDAFQHPEDIGYIHITIGGVIHWFYPINCGLSL